MQILTYLLARFSEPSSYAGVGAYWLCSAGTCPIRFSASLSRGWPGNAPYLPWC